MKEMVLIGILLIAIAAFTKKGIIDYYKNAIK